MSSIRLVLVGGLLVGLLGACSGEQAEQPRDVEAESAGTGTAGQIALLGGGSLEVDGRWLFVNYWAEWCAPCLVEIPELNEFQAEAADRVVVLGINFDGLPPEVMAPQVERLDIRFPIAVNDAGEVLGIELPEVLPSTYVFDPDGRQVGVLLGPQTLEQLYAAMEN